MKTTKHALYSQDQDQFIKWFDKYDAQAIKEAIVEHLGKNPDDTLEHCKGYGKGSVKNYYGHEIVNFYENNPKNGKPCKVYMKNGKEYLRALTLSLCLLFVSFAATAQTIIDIPIEAKDPYIIKIWTYSEATSSWGWYDVRETGIEYKYGWIYNNHVNIEVDRYDVLDCLFIRGFDQCADTTKVTIYGSFDKEKIKDKPNLRKKISVDGGSYKFGTKIKRPEQWK